MALLVQPGWAPALVLLGLTFLLFPDGRPPSPRWRWVLWASVAVGAMWILAALVLTVEAIIGHNVHVDPGGNLTALDNYGGPRGTSHHHRPVTGTRARIGLDRAGRMRAPYVEKVGLRALESGFLKARDGQVASPMEMVATWSALSQPEENQPS